MQQFGGKDSKRHFTVVMGDKEHGLYVSSSPSSAAKKAVTKLCTANKSKKVEFYIREITQGSKKKTYGPYVGYIEKLKEPIELKGRVIKYKPVAKLSDKNSKKMKGGEDEIKNSENKSSTFNSLSGITPNNVEGLKKNAQEKAVKAQELRKIANQKKQNATDAHKKAYDANEKAKQSQKVYNELLKKREIQPATIVNGANQGNVDQKI
jgi:hypothetical protein